MTKQKLGVFAEVSGELKLIHTGSVRFSRANRAALKADKFYPGVFFSAYTSDRVPSEDGKSMITTYAPVGERHKPKHVTFESLGIKPLTVDLPVAQRMETRKRRTRGNRAKIDYNEVDPHSGESLNDVLVDMHRERLARESR